MTLPDETDVAVRQQRRFVYGLILALFSGISIAAILNSQPLRSANDRSRWCTVWALVERGTYQIDEIDANPAWHTIDKVRHDGHFYSSKPPLLPTIMAGLYWGLRQVTGWSVFSNKLEVTRTLLLITNFVPLLIWLILLARICDRHAQRDSTRYLTLLVAAFGTLLTAFQTTFNNHSAGAASLGICLYAMSRILADGETRARFFLLSGFFAALLCTCELPAALFGILSFLLLVVRDPKRTFAAYVPAALIPLGAFFVTNFIATGGWKPFYMYYGTEKYRFVIDGIPSYWMNPRGLDVNGEPPWLYFLHCVIGHHGIFSLSPVFLLSAIGVLTVLKSGQQKLRTLILSGGMLSVCILAFYLTRTQNYNYGGNSGGLRWMFWLIPFWILALIPALDLIWPKFKKTVLVCCAVSFFSVAAAIPNPWHHPWMLTVLTNAGVVNYSQPFPPLERTHQTWLTQLPADDALPASVTFEEQNGEQSSNRITLELSGADGERISAQLTFKSGEQSETFSFALLRTLFDAGETPGRFVETDSPAKKQRIIGFFSCSRAGGKLRQGPTRWLKTPLRQDAYETRRCSSRGFQKAAGRDTAIWHRCNAWISDEFAFGTLQIEKLGTNALTGEVIYKRRWRVVECDSADKSPP